MGKTKPTSDKILATDVTKRIIQQKHSETPTQMNTFPTNPIIERDEDASKIC